MEIMVIVFILAVVFNVVGTLLKQAAGSQSRSAPAGRPAARPAVSPHPPGPPRHDLVSKATPDPAGEGISMEGSAAARLEEGAASRPAGAALRRREPPAAAQRTAAGLQRLFTQKDRLLHAFIFNEIIGPPRSRR